MFLGGQIRSGLGTLLRRKRRSAELDEQLSAYLGMAADDKVQQGMSPGDALRAVRIEQGSARTTREEVAAAGWESFVETSWRDLRFAPRTCAHGFPHAAIAGARTFYDRISPSDPLTFGAARLLDSGASGMAVNPVAALRSD